MENMKTTAAGGVAGTGMIAEGVNLLLAHRWAEGAGLIVTGLAVIFLGYHASDK